MKSRFITKSSKQSIFINDVFGSKEQAVSKVRETLSLTDCNDGFLTDEIILAPLHIDTAIKLSEDIYSFINSEDTKKAEIAKKCCLYRLCGCICHALSSRVKRDSFEAYRNIDWLKMSADFHFVADSSEMHLKIAKMK